jgi:hypothetical protein
MTQNMSPPTLQQIATLAGEMAANPTDALHNMRMLAKWLGAMPPPEAELMSPPAFKPTSLWTNAAVFENVAPDEIREGIQVRAQRNLWIRGVVAQAIPIFESPDGEPLTRNVLDSLATANRVIFCPNATNFRGLFEMNYRLNGSQGFISRGGSTETFAPAVTITGDGLWQAPMDWKLETNDHIQVSIRNTTQRRNSTPPGSINVAQTLRLVVVAFWGVDMGTWSPTGGDTRALNIPGRSY